MVKLNAIIVDDERLARVYLAKLLSKFDIMQIVSEADSCTSAIEAINKYQPDIVFLDIQLKGEKGFDILNKISSVTKIVFVTAYDEYAIRAFEINAVDYLLKPVNPERLKKTIERIAENIDLTQNSNTRFEYTDSVLIKMDSYSSRFITIRSIVHITSIGNYSKLFAQQNDKYVVLKTLKQWESELPDDKFVRIHRSQIINIEYLNRIEKYSQKYYRIYLNGIDEPFEISRRYMANLKKNFNL